MGMTRRRKDFAAHSARVTRDRRWPGLRLQVLRRDGFACVKCNGRGRLEVDHIEPVRDRPDLAFDLSNLQSLCRSCHSRKTRKEVGLAPPNPERDRWRALLGNMETKHA